nr:MAG TPA: hypothetical protein [Caudoviricetes sp.]
MTVLSEYSTTTAMLISSSLSLTKNRHTYIALTHRTRICQSHQRQTSELSVKSWICIERDNMSSESRPMEVIKHNLDCKCHRRREWIRVNDKWHAIEFSVDDPNEPPMTEEEKANIALIIQQHLSKESE